jgi:DNA-binding MarR family transcriptional regulator
MAKTRWLNEREAHLWRSWLRLNQELPSLLADQILRSSGLSLADYAVLVALSESPGGMLRARELGRAILWDRSRLSHHVGRMERRGLVTRQECTEDARGAMVRMTDAGRAAIKGAAPGHVAATRRYFFDLLSDQEIDTLTAVFDRVLINLGLGGGIETDKPTRITSSGR